MLYPAHVGALQRIEESSSSLTHLCGVSGGAIVAAARASGFEGKNLTDLILNTLPGQNQLIDYSWLPWKNYGVIKGDRILEAFRSYFAPTFQAAFEATGIELSVITTNLSTRAFKVWNRLETPQADLPLAVRASMSIPLVFRYVDIDGCPHVDGGVLSNFPLDIYGSGEDVVGVRIYKNADPIAPGDPEYLRDFHNFPEYLNAILDSMLTAIVREHVEDAVFARLMRVHITGGDYTTLAFDLTRSQALSLIQLGYDTAMPHEPLK